MSQYLQQKLMENLFDELYKIYVILQNYIYFKYI